MAQKPTGTASQAPRQKHRSDQEALGEARATLPRLLRESVLIDLDYDHDELARMHQIVEFLPDKTVLDLSEQLKSVTSGNGPDYGAFSEYFGISPAERLLLDSLVEGLTVVAHAGKAGISVNTARTHMRRLLEKTGSNGQLDLIRKAHGKV